MSTSVVLPALGESVTEGTVTRWLKKVGDTVEVDEACSRSRPTRSTPRSPRRSSGVIEEILVQEDETVEVGAVLAKIGDGGSAPASDDAPAEQAAPPPRRPRPSSPRQSPRLRPPRRPRRRGARPRGRAPAPAAGRRRRQGCRPPGTRRERHRGHRHALAQAGRRHRRGRRAAARDLDRQGRHRDPLAVRRRRSARSSSRRTRRSPSAPPLARIGDERRAAPLRHRLPPGRGSGSRRGGPAARARRRRPPRAGPGACSRSGSRAAAPAAPAPAARGARAGSGTRAPPRPTTPTSSAYVTPLVRRLAQQQGVDLATVTGTGVGGRIRKEDVLNAAEAASAPAAAPAAAPRTAPSRDLAAARHDPADVAPAQGARRARRRLDAVDGAADDGRRGRRHEARELPRQGQGRLPRQDRRQAVVPAVLRPRRRRGAAGLPGRSTRPSTATRSSTRPPRTSRSRSTPSAACSRRCCATRRSKNLAQIAHEIADLAARTRDNKLKPDELAGGTFTLTNTGSRGALFDTPVVFLPQSAILGTGVVVKRPGVVVGRRQGRDRGPLVRLPRALVRPPHHRRCRRGPLPRRGEDAPRGRRVRGPARHLIGDQLLRGRRRRRGAATGRRVRTMTTSCGDAACAATASTRRTAAPPKSSSSVTVRSAAARSMTPAGERSIDDPRRPARDMPDLRRTRSER